MSNRLLTKSILGLRLSLLFLCALLIFAFYFTKGNVLNTILKPYLETMLSRQLDVEVTIKKINLSILKASFEASEITLRDMKHPQQPTVLCAIPEIKASLQWRQLLVGRLALHKALIESPRLSLLFSPSQKKKKKFRFQIPWTPILHFEFNEIKIKQADVTIQAPGMELLQPNITITATPQKDKSFKVVMDSLAGKSHYKDMRFSTGQIHIDGRLFPKNKWMGRLSLKDIAFQKYRLDQLSAAFSFEKQRLWIQDVLLAPETGPLRAHAEIRFSEIYQLLSASLDLNENLFHLKTLENGFHLRAPHLDLTKIFSKKYAVRGEGKAEGKLLLLKGVPKIDADVTLHDAYFKNIFLGNLEGKLRWQPGALSTHLAFKHPDRPAFGTLEASLAFNKKQLSGQGRLRAHQFFLFNEYCSTLSVPFSISNQTLELSDAFLKKKNGTLNISGTLREGQEISLKIRSDQLAIEEFDTLPFAFRGPLNVNAVLGGTWKDPRLEARVDTPNIWVRQKQTGPSSLQMSLKDKKLTLTSNLFDQQLTQSGFVRLSPPYAYGLEIRASQLDFAPYLSLLQKDALPLDGAVSGTLSLTGSLKDRIIDQGLLTIASFQLQGAGIAFSNPHPIVVAVKENVILLKSLSIRGTDTAIEATGQKDANDQLSFTVEGPLNMKLLQFFIPFIEKSGGKAKIVCKISGTTSAPILFGTFNWTDGDLKTQWFPHSLENIHTSVSFSKKKVVINKFDGLLGGGNIQLMGDITLTELSKPSLDLKASLSNSRLQIPEWLSSAASGAIYVQGIAPPYTLSGKLFVSEAAYKQNLDWQSQILSFKKKRYVPRAREALPPLLVLNIAIQAPRNVIVKNDIADLEAKADVVLKGTSDQLNLTGKIDLISGTATFKENRFNLSSANALFDNPITIDPKFNILADTMVKEYKITLSLEGTISKYSIHLASQPPLPEGDIISLLTLGATRAEVEKQGILDVTSLELGSMFFGDIQKAVQSAVKKTLGLKFALTPSYSDTKHATVPRLFIGKKISERTETTFSSTLDRSAFFSDKEFNIKYNINKNLAAAGFWEDRSDEIIQDNASIGVDLKIQFEFK